MSVIGLVLNSFLSYVSISWDREHYQSSSYFVCVCMGGGLRGGHNFIRDRKENYFISLTRDRDKFYNTG